MKKLGVAAIGLGMLCVARGLPAADADRGRALYESRCTECHSESVHGRAKRVAADFADVRRWVSRWSDNLGLRWGEGEIDDVSVYLNDTYYRYPCPREVCKVVSMNRGSRTYCASTASTSPRAASSASSALANASSKEIAPLRESQSCVRTIASVP